MKARAKIAVIHARHDNGNLLQALERRWQCLALLKDQGRVRNRHKVELAGERQQRHAKRCQIGRVAERMQRIEAFLVAVELHAKKRETSKLDRRSLSELRVDKVPRIHAAQRVAGDDDVGRRKRVVEASARRRNLRLDVRHNLKNIA